MRDFSDEYDDAERRSTPESVAYWYRDVIIGSLGRRLIAVRPLVEGHDAGLDMIVNNQTPRS